MVLILSDFTYNITLSNGNCVFLDLVVLVVSLVFLVLVVLMVLVVLLVLVVLMVLVVLLVLVVPRYFFHFQFKRK